MELYTINSKLIFDNNYLTIKKMKNDTSSYWFHSFVLYGCMVGFYFYKAMNQDPLAWFMVFGIITVWMYPHWVRIFKILFLFKWGNRIKIADIKDVSILPKENELETAICLKLKSGRQKHFVFRTLEKQAEHFVAYVQEQQMSQLATVNC